MGSPTRVIVTGACGFIGSVMCARLSELGYDVIALDNQSRGLNDVSELPHVTFIERDCEYGISTLMTQFEPKAVFHLAAATGDLSRPVEELRQINTEMTKLLFQETLSYSQEAVFIFPTTSLALAVPDSSYVQTKEEAVAWLRDHAQRDRILLFRFFNNAGAYRGFSELRKNEVHIIPRLWQAYREGRPFIINGDDYETADGTPARDYIHVKDCVDFLIYSWGLKRGGRLPWDREIIEVGRGKPMTVKEVMTAFRQAVVSLGISHDPVDWYLQTMIGPRRAFDCGSLSCSTAERLWSWRPLKSLETIVRDEIEALWRYDEKQKEQP